MRRRISRQRSWGQTPGEQVRLQPARLAKPAICEPSLWQNSVFDCCMDGWQPRPTTRPGTPRPDYHFRAAAASGRNPTPVQRDAPIGDDPLRPCGTCLGPSPTLQARTGAQALVAECLAALPARRRPAPARGTQARRQWIHGQDVRATIRPLPCNSFRTRLAEPARRPSSIDHCGERIRRSLRGMLSSTHTASTAPIRERASRTDRCVRVQPAPRRIWRVWRGAAGPGRRTAPVRGVGMRRSSYSLIATARCPA